MAEKLADWPTPEFIDTVLSRLPAPISPATGEPLWENGVRLHGAQNAIIKEALRFKQVTGGWRAGKSFVGAVAIFLDVLWRWEGRTLWADLPGVTDDLYWIVGPTYELAEEEMNHLGRLFSNLDIPFTMHTPQGDSWRMTFPHVSTVIRTLSGRDPARIASKAPRGVVGAEAAQLLEDAKDAMIGRVSQTRGWVLWEGTFETAGEWYRRIAEEWKNEDALGKTYPLPSWDNLLVYPGGRQDPEILAREKSMSPSRFLERYGGEAARRSDLVMIYADKDVHVAHRYPNLKTSFDPEQPVYLFSDPGISHAYAVLAVQFWGGPQNAYQYGPYGAWNGAPRREVCWVIDAVYRWGRGVDAIVAECASRPWAEKVDTVVMDVAARQRRAEGPAIVSQWDELWIRHTGRRVNIYTDLVPLQIGYDLHKRLLLNSWPEHEAQKEFNRDRRLFKVTDIEGPRLMFDPDAAAPLFGGEIDDQWYAGEYNLHRNRKNPDGTIASDVPIDEDNDAIKAINYGLYWRYGPGGNKHTIPPSGASMPWAMEV